tara:strand:- start:785 stop:1627 length:843 start_codon:yes stop_codon:yes gene_type:complete
VILLDNSQIILASIFQSIKYNPNIDDDFIRHLVLNTYRMYRSKFPEYGELIICNDAGGPWRRGVFEHYKAARKKQQKDSSVDWSSIYDSLTSIRNEVRDNLPYKNLTVDACEADDIIAVLTARFHQQEKIMIISGDKDFQQLQVYPGVNQYSPIQKKMLVCDRPDSFLFNHIMKGDVSDGVPNILSDDDTFVVEGKRQKPMNAKAKTRVREVIDGFEVDETISRNYDRNRQLIDFNYIPSDVVERINENYDTQEIASRSGLLDYFIQKGLKNLMESIGDF